MDKNKEECTPTTNDPLSSVRLSFHSHTEPKEGHNGVLDYGVFGIPFGGLAYYQGNDIVFRFVIRIYRSLRDFGPLGNK